MRSLIPYEGGLKPGDLRFDAPERIAHLQALADSGRREELLVDFMTHEAGVNEAEVASLRSASSWQARVVAAHTIPRELQALSAYGTDFERVRHSGVPIACLVGGASIARRREGFAAGAKAVDARVHVQRVRGMPRIRQHRIFSRARSPISSMPSARTRRRDDGGPRSHQLRMFVSPCEPGECGIVRNTNDNQSDPAGWALRVERVTKTYGEGDVAVHALRGVDLGIRPGEFVVVLGPSGSGKTTLMNVIGAIERPTSGSVLVPGYDVASLAGPEATTYRRAHLGFVFQFFNLIGTLTAVENVQLIAELMGPRGEGASQEALRAVGLADRMDRFPSQLSGGEQQRVAIARAIVKRPQLLLADEPTGSLDLETGRVVLSLLRRLGRENGHAVILVTHNAAIAQMADRVVRMRSGQIVDDVLVPAPLPAEAISW